MEPEAKSAPGLEQRRAQWLQRLEQNLARASFSHEELSELARRYRTLAEATGSRGVRRAALSAAERFERAARGRVAANP